MAENNNLNGKRSWTEYFRILTPFLLLVLTWLGSGINSRLDKIDEKISTLDSKIFTHLTNSDMHIARASVVTRDEYNIVQKMRDVQLSMIERNLEDIKDLVKDLDVKHFIADSK